MADSHCSSTPIVATLYRRLPDEPEFDKAIYCQAVGSIMYAALSTRPDLTHAISLLGRYACDPSIHHWNAVKRLLRYVKWTIHLQLYLNNWSSNEQSVTIYADADFARDCDEAKSTTGLVV